jgi:hypothetical protein
MARGRYLSGGCHLRQYYPTGACRENKSQHQHYFLEAVKVDL